MLKRAFDVTVALAALVPGFLVVFIAGVLVRMDSPGPAIFRQTRIGRGGQPFTCLKLRTMRVGTPNLGTHDVQASSVTKIGGILRKTKLDEIPQLWNVLVGEMSLVGPRPCLPNQTHLIDERRKRGVLEARPGITGLAQVEGIDMSEPERLATVDAEYLKSLNFLTDLKLLVMTATGKGQRDGVKA